MNLHGPLIGMYNYPTIVIFCEGLGIAAAKALIEATAGVGGLSFPLRRDVRMYYRVRGIVPGRSGAPGGLRGVCSSSKAQ